MLLKNADGTINSELQGEDGQALIRMPDAYDDAEGVVKFAMLRWDTDTLAWVKFSGSSGGVASDVSVLNFPATQEVTGSVETTSTQESVRLDEASSTVTYFGYAPTGTATSSAGWRIKRLSVSGSETSILFADGNTNYDNVWDNRAILSYS